MSAPLDIVVLGLSLRSSWGNGHATTYRALIEALGERGHRVLFLERDMPWYAQNQDAPDSLPGRLEVYASLDELDDRHADAVAQADLVIVGSYVPDGIAVGEWAQSVARGVVAFYDIDTPVTLARLAREDCEYLHPRLIPGYALYLSFTGGPTLQKLEREYRAPLARPLYCSADPRRYGPSPENVRFDLGYMGTYSDDRQPGLERLLFEPARAWSAGYFVVAGPQYPAGVRWPPNVHRIEHLAPDKHRRFYNEQRFTLNLTRADMVAAGWSPSVRLFEAAACATPIISDAWPGLEAFFVPGQEILIARSGSDVVRWIRDMPEARRRRIGEAARHRVLNEHTAAHRAQALERYFAEAAAQRRRTRVPARAGRDRGEAGAAPVASGA
ncbi:CgeB family protein [Vulcaniibacterium tengchongense]|uniref:Spore maturation protein CgeB n=1 Tax=Vulcaniibacterium tengchongense TaxID=1273429 RepID=A0A3N4W7F4_9GAMM|nr:glycosyltransferase [Vulcaniibacterium tengchongense]RPE81134.1 spore maturation protein CgeB [Vulcaniibacterium tengchongense]